ncbi:MAG TPA: ADP-ribosylglycohydrolase family protein, partial [Trebonia sp.]
HPVDQRGRPAGHAQPGGEQGQPRGVNVEHRAADQPEHGDDHERHQVRATGLVAGLPPEEAAEVIYALVGTSLATQESVPAAFAVLSAVPGDPWRACRLAASLGGDCDTIAAMAGAIGGAIHGLAAFPAHAVAVIDAQGLGLADLADALLAVRR